MSWDKESVKVAAPVLVPEVKDEPKVEPVVAEAEKVEAVDSGKTESKQEEAMVPQKLLGKVAKAIREKSKVELSAVNERLKALEEENRKLKEGEKTEPDPYAEEEEKRIALKVRETFLKQENARGRKKYGQDYQDALDLIASQNDPALANKIQWADDPVTTLLEEAERIADALEYGSDPSERERKKELALEDKIRKKIEAEFSEKLKARNNQTTDVQNVRAAGGDDKPKYQGDSWETSLPK